MSYDSQELTNVDTDASGQFTVSFTETVNIDSPALVNATATGGYVANVASVSGNTATITLYESAGANAEMATVASGTDVTDVNAVAFK